MEDSKTCFLVIGTGRSGSSLLSAILADAGANFAMGTVKSWNPSWGEYEHSLLHVAEAWRSRIRRIRASVLPDRLTALCEPRMKQALAQLFDEADFAKSIPLVGMVDEIYRLGFKPVLIVNYRAFQEYARSILLSRSFWDMPKLMEQYVATYSTAILQLEIFGGCTIGYDELVDPGETAWAQALSEITKIPQERLLEHRSQRVNVNSSANKRPESILDKSLLDPRIALLYEALSSLKGRALPPESRR
jgi:hypothetical protein